MDASPIIVDIELHGAVTIVRWNDNENRFSLTSLLRWHAVLDQLESSSGPLAVVVTGHGKYFSNGLDLESLAQSPSDADEALRLLHRLFGRLLLFPACTVAALNGHVFAAGAMMASCFDYRIMREDRGYWCLPEADLGLPLTSGMFAAVTARLPVSSAAEAMNSGRRYGAVEARQASLIDEYCSLDELFDVATRRATEMAGKDRHVIAQHKRMLFGEAALACGYSSDALSPGAL
jgi:enoyl-CoA hydratase/carnithine racemase